VKSTVAARAALDGYRISVKAGRTQSFHLTACGGTMHLTAAHISPIIALLAGILILIAPRLLNYVVAVYLIIVGLTGLNAIHHFIR
jgi:hypothetical protein